MHLTELKCKLKFWINLADHLSNPISEKNVTGAKSFDPLNLSQKILLINVDR